VEAERYLKGLTHTAALRRGVRFSRFLDPAEAALATAAAREEGVEVSLFGGYGEAERVVAAFGAREEPEYPLCCMEVRWSSRAGAPRHRDLLGAQMALGLDRGCFGDILVGEERAYLFVLKELCAYIALNLDRAGNVPIALTPLDRLPDALPRPVGRTVRGTVSSLRLDAVVAQIWSLSRSGAQEAIAREKVKLAHIPRNKCDVQVETGEVISLKGRGRARILSHTPTKKGRIALEIFIYGNN
jgi:RNA-binding protein YlmH